MTFLYTSLGILFFSSIVLVHKSALLFSDKIYKSDYFEVKYTKTSYQQIDRFLLDVLKNDQYGLNNFDNICYFLKAKLSKAELQKKDEFFYYVFPETHSKHEDLVNSCVLTNGKHRILVKRDLNDYFSFKYNSCILKKNDICNFEKL
tara:strand:- start:150 stop:590 length:441 start_codon:yes stop_codon:yes gene_type:complete